MPDLPNIRIARITYLYQYNRTQSASDVQWIWKEGIRDEIQYQNTEGEWTPIPIVPIRDESAKEHAELKKKQEIEAIDKKNNEMFEYLKKMDDPKTHWESVDNYQYGCILDSQNAEFDKEPDEDGYFCYYSNEGKIAKSKNGQQLVRGDILMNWVDPEKFIKDFTVLLEKNRRLNPIVD